MFFWNSCFFYDPVAVGNLTSGSSAFSKSSLNIWKFTVHVLLKPSLKNFEHYSASMWDECNCVVVWHSLALPFFGIGMKTDLFQSWDHCWVFKICWHIKITALSNSMKLWAMPCRATRDEWFMVESSDKMWSAGEGNGKPLQYFNLITLMKGSFDIHKDCGTLF